MKVIGWIIGIPLAAVMIILAVGNRHDVTLSAAPAPFELQLPLALLIFACLVVGVFWGGIAGWLSQGKLRETARRNGFRADIAQRDLEAAERRIKALQSELETAQSPGREKTNLPSLPKNAA